MQVIKTDSIIFDFSETFNKASHRKLIIKLDYLRVLGNTLKWVAGFIQNHSQRALNLEQLHHWYYLLWLYCKGESLVHYD